MTSARLVSAKEMPDTGNSARIEGDEAMHGAFGGIKQGAEQQGKWQQASQLFLTMSRKHVQKCQDGSSALTSEACSSIQAFLQRLAEIQERETHAMALAALALQLQPERNVRDGGKVSKTSGLLGKSRSPWQGFRMDTRKQGNCW